MMGLLLLGVAGLLLLGQTFSLRTAPFNGNARLEGHSLEPGWQVKVDSRSWDGPYQSLLRSAGALNSGILAATLSQSTSGELGETHPNYPGGPRVDFRYNQNGIGLEGRLYQSTRDTYLLSGPLTLRSSKVWFKDPPSTALSRALSLVPSKTPRALLLDTDALVWDQGLRSKLVEQLEVWEIDPFTDLMSVVRGPLVHLGTSKGSVLCCRLLSKKKLQALVDARFPSGIISRSAKWSMGSRIVGLFDGLKPAWCTRGDYLMVSPVDGMNTLDQYLKSLGRSKIDTRAARFQEEFRRLIRVDKGWHLILIENSEPEEISWAVALRFKGADAQGFLIVHAPQGSRKDLAVDASI